MIKATNISKEYVDQTGFKVELLKNVSFEIPNGKVVSIVAPTGAGKSSLLKIIAGLVEPTEGSIDSANGKIVFLPSEPSSFPWLNVYENVVFGLDSFDEEKVKSVINFVGLEGYEDHRPANKSVGFRFRIALARSLMHEPSLIVIDESFNEMKSETKNDIYDLIRNTIIEFNLSILVGTTNITEALLLSDNIVAMGKKPGRVIGAFDISYEAERDANLVTNAAFKEYKNKIENTILEALGKDLFTFKL